MATTSPSNNSSTTGNNLKQSPTAQMWRRWRSHNSDDGRHHHVLRWVIGGVALLGLVSVALVLSLLLTGADIGRRRHTGIVHLDTIVRAVHLVPNFRDVVIPVDFHFSHSLDAFTSYYINKYADYHTHECIY